MLEIITEAASALQAETSTYPEAVQIWMRLMGLSFLCSIFFVYTKPGARWILLALLLNLLGLLVGKITFPEQSRTAIGTCVHLLFWPPLLWAVWRPAPRRALFNQLRGYFDRIYFVWLCWASLLMSVSLILDARTLVMMLS
ncbi:MAG: hypothetical protein ABJ308_09665 [Halieaceae bacterium]